MGILKREEYIFAETTKKNNMRLSNTASNQTFVNIVSGIPRSGTSMMMAMLQAGGISVLTDQRRLADQDNPKGYFEFERVKKLPEGDVDWLIQAQGRVVKIIATLLIHLPEDYHYRIIFMRRSMVEIIASQQQMLTTQNKIASAISDTEMGRLFEQHLAQVRAWIEKQPNITCLDVNYNTLMLGPESEVHKINHFLSGNLDVQAMLAIIDPDLYRQQSL